MGGPVLDPDERAVWRVLLDAPAGDHFTLIELSAVASVAAGQRIDWFSAHAIIGDMWQRGLISRTVVQRSGQPRQQAYALNLRGRARAGRLLGQ
jgi:hypothetical protein